MTDLNRTIRRRTHSPYGHQARRIVVILEPGDLLGMRLEGTRTTYRAPLDAVFRRLALWHAQAEAARRKEERRRRHQASR